MSSRFPTVAILSSLVACATPAVAPCPVTPAAVVTTTPASAPAVVAPPAPASPPAPVVSGYDKPPPQVLEVLHAPASPSPVISPTRDKILLVSNVRYPAMAQVAEPFLKLAGVRVEPRTRRKHDTPGGYGVAPCAQALAIVDVATSAEKAIPLPPGGCADAFTWAADGKRYAFRNTSTDAVELWVGDATGSTRRIGNLKLNPMLGSSLQWLQIGSRQCERS